MKIYNQLTLEQRYEIQGFMAQKLSKATIAQELDVSLSTIYRELARNADKRSGKYKALLAHQKCTNRHSTKPKKIRFTEAVRQRTEELLKQDYSPEQVCGKLRTLDKDTVSTERIYQHIWQDKKRGGTLYKHLRHRGKRYRKRGDLKDHRGLIINRVDIEQRPTIVEEKNRLGDLEIDTVIGKNHKGVLLTINCRATGMVKIEPLKSKSAEQVYEATLRTLDEWKPWLHTITSDNGKEFAKHSQIAAALNIDFYFAKPYHSWQRGANENLNGLIRQYFPKGTDLSKITMRKIKEVEAILNNRPRKRFKFKSPKQMMAKYINQNNNFALIT